jgi:hypothetical protein
MQNDATAHVVHVDAPSVGACVPGAHRVHIVAPPTLNEPMAQRVHVDAPAVLKRPAGHGVRVAAEPAHEEPAEHGTQVVAVGDGRNSPGAHDAHELAVPAL